MHYFSSFFFILYRLCLLVMRTLFERMYNIPSEVGSFFENVVLNEAIWCTIFHHFSYSLSFVSLSYEGPKTGWSKKWVGQAPPVKIVGGPVAPLAPPPPPVPPPMQATMMRLVLISGHLKMSPMSAVFFSSYCLLHMQ